MHIALPESFREYASRNDVRTAVDHILSCDNRKKLEVPFDLEWCQLPEFHSAVLAAHQVRCDYAILLHELWNGVWDTALKSAGSRFEPFSIAEAHDYEGTANMYDAYSVWENFECGRYVRRKGHRVWLSVHLDRGEAVLWLWVGDSDGNDEADALKAMISAKGWRSEPEKGDDGINYGRTKKGIAPIRDGELELGRLVSAAEGALRRLAGPAT